MNRAILSIWLTVWFCGVINAEAPVVSGTLDSKAVCIAGAGNADAFSAGVEEYANLRLQTKIRDNAVFYGAFNLFAMSGSSAQEAAGLGDDAGFLATPFVKGRNYAGAIELERLYFRVNSEYVDFDAGLMRLGFGYGQTFAPSDFLNPRNPLVPDARLRGVLGAAGAFYPGETKLLIFAAGPKDPLNTTGGGFLFGVSGEHHWDMASLQGLYAFETPDNGSAYGVHRGGLSLKVDWKAGVFADLLYVYNHEAGTDINGLAASVGLDYSFYDGNVYVLAEYLFCGADSAVSVKNGHIFFNRNYLSAMIRYSFTDYTHIALTILAGFDDISFAPVLMLEHELFQGLTLSLSCGVPLDQDLFTGNGKHGEFGPLPFYSDRGNRAVITAKARLRF
jgi:hypothetical protein